MRARERFVLRTVEHLGREPRLAPGLVSALGSGLAVGGAVARIFFESHVLAGLGLGALAFACTAAGTWRAARASTAGRAVLWTLGANVTPPTLVFLPTIIGLFFAVPAGLIAFAAVCPFALLTRADLARDAPGRAEREWLRTAGFMAIVATFAAPHAGLGGWHAPAAVVAGGAVALSMAAFARDVRRAYAAWSVERERAGALRAVPAGPNTFMIGWSVPLGAGAHRSATAHEPVGELRLSWRRGALALGIAGWSALLLLAAAFVR